MIHGVDHRFGASIHVQRTVCFVISLVNGLCEVDPYSTWNQTSVGRPYFSSTSSAGQSLNVRSKTSSPSNILSTLSLPLVVSSVPVGSRLRATVHIDRHGRIDGWRVSLSFTSSSACVLTYPSK
jgi:hypothetical protein